MAAADPGAAERRRDRRHHAGGGFRNPWPTAAEHGVGDFLRWVLQRWREGRPPDPPRERFARESLTRPRFPHPRAAADRLVVTWVGHSSFLVQAGGLNLLTDPVWSERASPLRWIGPRRWVPPGIPLDELPPVDAVLLSHDHYDHLDARTVRRLARAHPDAAWLVPLGVAARVRRWGAREVRELDWWDATPLGGGRAVCVPAQHFSGRGLHDRNRTLWCGWVIDAPPARLYFAGDTGWFPGFDAIAERFAPFDAVFLPIGAYDPRWFMRAVHADAEEAVDAYGVLTRRGAHRPVMVPMHWGTFKLTDEPMDEPPRRALRAWAAAGHPADRLWTLRHGETRELEGPASAALTPARSGSASP